MRKRILILAAVALLAGVGALVWSALGWPPVRLVLRYGIPPTCRPTGDTVDVLGHEMVQISPGCFRMGSTSGASGDFLGRICKPLGLPWGDPPRSTDEMPLHWVEFPRGFLIAKHEVTNAQYERFDPDHERSESSSGDGAPVVDVLVDEARAYCAWLEERTDLDVRLPSEAEWECAARAGSEAEYCFGDDPEGLREYAWYGQNILLHAREVGTRRANAWGLHDLHGNVWEWCEDRWHDDYSGAPEDGSAWTSGGSSYRVSRGGSWRNYAGNCRSAIRDRDVPGYRRTYLGFRPAASGP